jgi:hypothetical protein
MSIAINKTTYWWDTITSSRVLWLGIGAGIGIVIGMFVTFFSTYIAPLLFEWVRTVADTLFTGAIRGFLIGVLIQLPLLPSCKNNLPSFTTTVSWFMRTLLFIAVPSFLVGLFCAVWIHLSPYEHDYIWWSFRHYLIWGAWIGCEAGAFLLLASSLLQNNREKPPEPIAE